MFRFDSHNVDLASFLLHDSLVTCQSDLRRVDQNTVDLELKRPNWAITELSNYYIFSILKVKTAKSIVRFKGVLRFDWTGDTINIETLEVYDFKYLDNTIEFQFVDDNKLRIYCSESFVFSIWDAQYYDDNYLRILNGSLENCKKWLNSYNRSIVQHIKLKESQLKCSDVHQSLVESKDATGKMKITITANYYENHPIEISENNLKSYDKQLLTGIFKGNISEINDRLIEEIEGAVRSMHSIECNVFGTDIKVNLNIYNTKKDRHNEIKLSILNLNSVEFLEEKSNISDVYLSGLDTVIVFTDDTNLHNITGKDHLKFLNQIDTQKTIQYNYDSAEIGTGHWSDSVIVALQTIGSGLFINEISRRYQNYIESRKKDYKPFKSYNLSDTVIKILNEHQISSNNAKIVLLETEEVSFDLHIHIGTSKGLFQFVIDSENLIKHFVIKE